MNPSLDNKTTHGLQSVPPGLIAVTLVFKGATITDIRVS